MTAKSVAASMARQGLAARQEKRRRALARAERQARKSPDLVKQNFTAPAPDVKWCGDLTEIPTGERTLYLAATEDLFSRRLLEFPGLAQIKTAIEKQEPDLANARRPYVSKIDRFGYF